jgi:hypothetical protein
VDLRAVCLVRAIVDGEREDTDEKLMGLPSLQVMSSLYTPGKYLGLRFVFKICNLKSESLEL